VRDATEGIRESRGCNGVNPLGGGLSRIAVYVGALAVVGGLIGFAVSDIHKAGPPVSNPYTPETPVSRSITGRSPVLSASGANLAAAARRFRSEVKAGIANGSISGRAGQQLLLQLGLLLGAPGGQRGAKEYQDLLVLVTSFVNDTAATTTTSPTTTTTTAPTTTTRPVTTTTRPITTTTAPPTTTTQPATTTTGPTTTTGATTTTSTGATTVPATTTSQVV